MTPQDTRQFAVASTALGLLVGTLAGGIGALWLGVYGLLVMVAAGMIRVGYEVWKLRRSTPPSGEALTPTSTWKPGVRHFVAQLDEDRYQCHDCGYVFFGWPSDDGACPGPATDAKGSSVTNGDARG